MKFDLLVVGDGLAALSLLLHLPESTKVGVISRGSHTESASYSAQGGISAVFSPDDDIEKHVQDTLTAGDGLCDQHAVRRIVTEGPAALAWLIRMGVPFTRENNEIHLTREGGHSERRVAHVDDMTGRSIMQTLRQKAELLPNVTWIKQCEAVELTSDGNEVTGLIVENLVDNDITVFNAAAVVLATGGITGLYAHATNGYASKGEAIAMAWRAGATIENLEFVQFHPTALLLDEKVATLITEAVRGEGGYLYNAKDERFMLHYSEQKELAPRDIVARAIYSEMSTHSAAHVWLDITHKGSQFVQHHFPNLVALTRRYGCDMSESRVPVAPAAHYTCGGIATAMTGHTGVKNLFAIGEVASSGLHGANRLASNSLLECIVMGKACAETICGTVFSEKHKLRKPIPKAIESNLCPSDFPELRSLLWNSAGIVRTSAGISDGLKRLKELTKNSSPLRPYGSAMRSKNIHDAAYLLLYSAALRRESRGGHFNTDYQAKDRLPAATQVKIER